MNDRDGHELKSRQLVTYVGINGQYRKPGKVSRVLRDCVRVRFDNGRVEDVHPHDLRDRRALTDQSDANSSLVPNACDPSDRSTQTGQEL